MFMQFNAGTSQLQMHLCPCTSNLHRRSLILPALCRPTNKKHLQQHLTVPQMHSRSCTSHLHRHSLTLALGNFPHVHNETLLKRIKSDGCHFYTSCDSYIHVTNIRYRQHVFLPGSFATHAFKACWCMLRQVDSCAAVKLSPATCMFWCMFWLCGWLCGCQT